MNQQLVQGLAQTIRSLSPEERQLLLSEVQRDHIEDEMREKLDAHEPQHGMNSDNANPPLLEPIPNHPLAAVVGTLKGELWEETLAEIQRARQADREYWQQVIEQQEQQDAS